MTEEAIDPTGERMNDPEGPDTPNRKPTPDDEKDEPTAEREKRESSDARPTVT
jgi:hypothetical protein